MSTRAIQYLKECGIAFEVLRYRHQKKGAAFAARAVGFPLAQTIKTLVVNLGQKKFMLALMPGDRQLSLKKLAAACKAKRAVMADTAAAQRLTGYQVGGISPFGTQKSLGAVMDQNLVNHGEVVINGGQRGVLLKMRPQDIIAVLAPQISVISSGAVSNSVRD